MRHPIFELPFLSDVLPGEMVDARFNFLKNPY